MCQYMLILFVGRCGRAVRKRGTIAFILLMFFTVMLLHSVSQGAWQPHGGESKDDLEESSKEEEDLLLAEDLASSLEALQRQISTVKTKCRKMVSLGGIVTCDCKGKKCYVDGAKLLCLDEDVRPAPGSCYALNFGIGFDLSFDKSLARYGCHVTAFDPTNINMTNIVHGGNVQALNLGIDDRDYQLILNMTFDDKVQQNTASFMTYETIINMLDNPKVDILKMDIEGIEWRVFRQILTSPKAHELLRNIKQILLEIHLYFLDNESSPATIYDKALTTIEILKVLEDYGFYLAAFELNETRPKTFVFQNLSLPLYREIMFIKRKPDPIVKLLHNRENQTTGENA